MYTRIMPLFYRGTVAKGEACIHKHINELINANTIINRLTKLTLKNLI